MTEDLMARQIPSFPDPRDPSAPLADAYAWLAGLALDLATGQGQFTINVHPHEAAWQSPPVAQIGIALGQVLGPGVTSPTLAELMADPEFAQAYTVIGANQTVTVALEASYDGGANYTRIASSTRNGGFANNDGVQDGNMRLETNIGGDPASTQRRVRATVTNTASLTTSGGSLVAN
jgi:hypothetical protein